MKITSVVAGALALVPALVSAAAPVIAQYYPAYSAQQPRSVPFASMDIAIYFVTVVGQNGLELPQYQADPLDFVNRAHAAGKKATFAVGGWTGSRYFSTWASTSTKRVTLSNQLKSFMLKYGFDGIDLDWEYPNADGIGCNARSSADAANFAAFLSILRRTIGSQKLLTAAVSVNGIIGADGNTMASLAQFGTYLNYINLMTYDIGGPWASQTGPVGPLRTCGSSDSSIEQAVNLWTSRGFPAAKILLGIPSYGISFTTSSSTLATISTRGYQSQIYQAWTKVVPKGMIGDGNAASTDICGNTSSGYNGQWNLKALVAEGILNSAGTAGINGFTRYFDQCTQTPFLFNPAKRQMICYDDAQSTGSKAAYAKSRGLGGVMIFDTQGFNSAVYTSIKRGLGVA